MSRDGRAGKRDSCSLGAPRPDSLPWDWPRPDKRAARSQADSHSAAGIDWARWVAENSRAGEDFAAAARLEIPGPDAPGSPCGRADFAAGRRGVGMRGAGVGAAGEVASSAPAGGEPGLLPRRGRVHRAAPRPKLRAKTGPGWPQREPPHASVPRSVSRSQFSPGPGPKKRNENLPITKLRVPPTVGSKADAETCLESVFHFAAQGKVGNRL